LSEFNVDWKAECGQLNIAPVSKSKKNIKKKLQQTNAGADCRLSPVEFQDPWRQSKWNQKDYLERVYEQMSFESGVKGLGSERWWDRRWWLWWGDLRRMRWTRRTVNRMRLTEWKRELIPCTSKIMHI